MKTSYGSTPAHLLKRAITDTEIAVTHSRFVFIGREAYEAAGGVVREDLFSAREGDGTADGVLVERLVQEKLAAAALAIEQQEGWSWSLAREGSVRNYGDDREHYLVLPAPEGNSALRSYSVLMNCTPRWRQRKPLRMKPRFRC